MGKSLKNIITPDDMYENYGADTFRLYEMGMGPLAESRPWNTRNVVGSPARCASPTASLTRRR